jgi:hypothetical protein
MYRLLALLSVFLLHGCASSYRTNRLYEQPAPARTERGGKVYVALPKPGICALTLYEQSGRMTADAIKRALSEYVAEVTVGGQVQDYDSALVSARTCGASMLIFPIINQWEERATEWSGLPDRISIKLIVANVTSGKRIDAIEINAKSKTFTLGGDHPQDLLDEPISEHFKSLF